MKCLLVISILSLFRIIAGCNPVSRGPYILPAKVSDIDVSRVKYFDSTGMKITKLFYDSTTKEIKALLRDSSKIDTGIIFYWY